MKRLLHYAIRYWKRYMIAIVCMIVALGLDMMSPQLVQKIIDDVIRQGNMSIFPQLIKVLIVITFAKAILGYIKEFLFDITSSRIVVNIRKDLFAHIQKLSFSFFDETNTGVLMTRMKEDAERILDMLSYGMMLLIEQCLYFFVSSIFLFKLSPKLAFFCLLVMPLLGVLAMRLEKKIGVIYEKISDQQASLNTTAQENIAGVRLVRAFGREKYEIQKFFDQNEKFYNLNIERANIVARYFPKIEFLSNIVIIIVTVGGGYLVIGEKMTVGKLIAFSQYMYMIIWPMRMIGWLINIIAQALASAKKIDEVFKEVPEIQSINKPNQKNNITGKIEFENVSFCLHGTEILKDISFTVESGETMAIMGETGSGKSSIIHLLARYYEPTQGTIRIDGIDIQDMDLTTLRQNISYVFQDSFLFSDTLRENMMFGNHNASNQQMKNVASCADVHSFASKMNKGYNTVIGERGTGLSGGQKQRVSIARALLKNSPILILDDATSALDMATEYFIQKAISKQKNRTKILIAHRISATKDADKIIVLDEGKVAERGSHTSLLEKKGVYYQVNVVQNNICVE